MLNEAIQFNDGLNEFSGMNGLFEGRNYVFFLPFCATLLSGCMTRNEKRMTTFFSLLILNASLMVLNNSACFAEPIYFDFEFHSIKRWDLSRGRKRK